MDSWVGGQGGCTPPVPLRQLHVAVHPGYTEQLASSEVPAGWPRSVVSTLRPPLARTDPAVFPACEHPCGRGALPVVRSWPSDQ